MGRAMGLPLGCTSMTAQDIIAKLFKPVDAGRIQKAKAAALRSKVEWAQVLSAMTDDQRQEVERCQS